MNLALFSVIPEILLSILTIVYMLKILLVSDREGVGSSGNDSNPELDNGYIGSPQDFELFASSFVELQVQKRALLRQVMPG